MTGEARYLKRDVAFTSQRGAFPRRTRASGTVRHLAAERKRKWLTMTVPHIKQGAKWIAAE